MEKEDTVSVQWAQEDVETSYSLLNNNNFFLILAHPVYKMRIIQEPNKLEL